MLRNWLCVVLLLNVATLHADDWPTFRHDNFRSGKTPQRLAAGSLRQAWVWQSPSPPSPAWAGPAKWDAYKGIRGLKSMRNYDPVFHVTAGGDSIWFGSSTDDAVHCLDAETGHTRWQFTTDGPVRIAPTLAGGRLHFGSDDGLAYCINAIDGKLIWQHSPAPRQRRILNNGRMISPSPCRTGVLVCNGTAYFAAGMLPWQPSYLCAVDAQTGEPTQAEHYVRQLSNVTMEGSLLASADRLFVPQGRVPPLVFDRAAGKSLGPLHKDGGGGCFVLLTDDAHVLHGPGNKTGWITDSDAATRAKVASFGGGNAMVVDGDTAYLLTDNQLAAIDRSSKKASWSRSCAHPYELILAGDTLVAGGRDSVAAFSARDGAALWEHAVDGRAYGLAVAGGRLVVSTDEGAVYCFQPDAKRNGSTAIENAIETADGSSEPAGTVEDDASTQALQLAWGPCVRFLTPTTAVVRWGTAKPLVTVLDCVSTRHRVAVEDSSACVDHTVELTGLRHDTAYQVVIREQQDGGQETEPFELDTFFNYTLPGINDAGSRDGQPADRAFRRAAEQILATPGVADVGICLVLGSADGRLALALAGQAPGLRVIGVDSDLAKVAAAQRAIQAAGAYGSRITITHVDSLEDLPFVGAFANLVVSEMAITQGECPGTAAEAYRMLAPGGTLAIGQPDAGDAKKITGTRLQEWFAGDDLAPKIDTRQGVWARLKRPPAAEAGVWSHQYGLADNSAYGGESLAGATSADQLRVQWLGRPGPRAQADRNGRKPSPLSTAGRLFVQGLHRIIALDAYNGSIVWSLEVPGFERFNIPRDCGNWCADEQHLFTAVKDKCWQIDAHDGRMSKLFDLPGNGGDDGEYDWGYVARHDGLLIGSAVKQGTSWTNFWGNASAGWYDARDGAVTHKICSDRLFALAKSTGEPTWTYRGGLVVNPTITLADDRIYFVECRNPTAIAEESRRLGIPEFWQDQYLVALDATTGKPVWQRPLKTEPGLVVFYLASGEGKLVLLSSNDKYHVYAFDAADGTALWNTAVDWDGKDHGHHMTRPAIVAGRVFVRPHVIDLASGEVSKTPMPGGGCGTYAMTDRTAIFRNRNVTMWGFEDDVKSSWSRLRPGCWLSTIPAAGMILSPEAGGGCSCGSWLETSIGFMPKE